MKRSLLLCCTAILIAGMAAGCADAGPNRGDVAAAKCSLPTKEKLADGVSTSTGRPVTYTAEDVESLGMGKYRVTGTAAVDVDGDGQQTHYTFACEVAPDDSDRLRGFKVTRLKTAAQDR